MARDLRDNEKKTALLHKLERTANDLQKDTDGVNKIAPRITGQKNTSIRDASNVYQIEKRTSKKKLLAHIRNNTKVSAEVAMVPYDQINNCAICL